MLSVDDFGVSDTVVVMRTSLSMLAAPHTKVDRVAHALISAKAETTVHNGSTFNQLQSYLLGNSHIHVFSLTGKKGEVVWFPVRTAVGTAGTGRCGAHALLYGQVHECG
jgi:hypothetical protein